MKSVYIMWNDSTSWAGWQKLPLKDEKMSKIETIGFVIKETKKKIIIAHSISDIGNAIGVLAIPKGSIIKWRENE